MTQGPQFYKQVVALSERKHRELRVAPMRDYRFAADTNAVVLAAAEFPFAAIEYPIVFLEVAGRVTPIAVLGLEPGRNLFLGDDGSWDARYIPAYVRRYPFMLARTTPDAAQMTVCIDETSARLNETEGERLFHNDGTPTAYLQQMIEFLKDYDRQARTTEALCTRLAASPLLEPMQANLSLPDGTPRAVGGFHAVDRDRLKALGAGPLYSMIENGELELIHAHLLSLRNFAALAARPRGAAPPARRTRAAKKKTRRRS